MSHTTMLDEDGNIIDGNPDEIQLVNEFSSEHDARIARQNEDYYTPEPDYSDLPYTYNQNRVSDFEYHYGEIAFWGTALLLVILFLSYLVMYSTP